MKQPVTPLRFAGRLRFFFALCIAALLCALPPPPCASAARLAWEALPDRERVRITMSESEGMAGRAARIAPTGVLIPYSEVPPGLVQPDPPEGAAIFMGTRQQGRALVLLTQTPEFGYVVSTQTPTEVVIDFFHNPLGARWKPSEKAPTTELPPDFAVPEYAPADDAARALAADPQGLSETSRALGETPADPAQADASAGPASVEVPAATAAKDASPGAVLQDNQAPTQAPAAAPRGPADAAKPVVVELSGTPEHASRATQMGEAPPSAAPQRSMLDREPARPDAPADGGPAANGPKPLLDARTQTAERAAPLPLPEPPLSFAPEAPDAATAPAAAPTRAPEPGPASSAPEGASPRPNAQADAQPGAQTGAQAAPAAPPATVPLAPKSSAAGTPGQTPNQTSVEAPGRAPSREEQASGDAPASAPPGPPPPGVGVERRGGVYGGEVNIGGLDAIPFFSGTPPPGSPAGRPPVPPDATPPGTGAAPEPSGQAPPSVHSSAVAVPESVPVPQPQANATEIIYTDAEGNIVPPPPVPELVLPAIRDMVSKGDYAGALGLADDLLQRGVLDREQREEALHVRAEMLFAVNKDKLQEQYLEISDAANQAISFNPKSPRNAAALLRLGYINLRLNNIPEAEARFNMLRRLYPNDENVPLTYYYWGDYHFGRNELQKAADEFQYVLQEYPNSRYAREAALGLARSFYRLGYYEQAFNIVDYIERRWERFYVEYPPFLNMMGDVAFRLNKLEYALRHYWLYVNLEPVGDEADIILTRLGDIYTARREKKAARELYTESMNRFPDKDGGLVAMMRLAEEGVNDDPTIAGMFSVFDGPFSLAPMEVYRSIIRKHPQSSLVPLAEVKLALWHLWKKEYTEVLDILSEFIKKYPKHELAPRAVEIALQTFAVLAAESMRDERYARMREMWEKYPIVREQSEIITPESRIALGVSFRHEGKPNEALQIVEPFFLGDKVPEYSEMALSLVLSTYLEYDQWESIREVARRVDLWELKPESQRQLDYALALAAENLHEPEKAAPIWQKLYESNELPPSQMAYAAFFLAREAERQRELEKAFFLGQEALSRLIAQVERSPNAADTGKIQTQLASLMDVAETAGRLRESLRFAEQYLQYLGADDPERSAVRYRMARIHKKQGDNETWKKILGELAAQEPNSVYGQLSASELKAASIAEDAARYSPTGRL